MKKLKLLNITKTAQMLRLLFSIAAIISLLTGVFGMIGLMKTGGGLVIVIAVLMVVSVIFLICGLLWVSRKIGRPLDEICDKSEKFSHGALNVEIDYHSEDDMGRLASSLNYAFRALKMDVDEISDMLTKMANGNLTMTVKRDYTGDFKPITDAFKIILTKLNHTFEVFQISAGQVSTSSQQMSDSSQMLAQGATEQASSIEELSASVQEISQKIDENSDYVSKVASYMDDTIKEVQENNEQMQKMLIAMDGISESSNEIGKIIKVINDIAFQTNILALNAAVEAARAGEAGKGFAVVADEVRNLASKSAGAAKQTTSLIEGTVVKIESGSKIAHMTAESLENVSDRMAKTDETITKIDQATSLQSEAAGQITQSVEQISSVIQTNSATAEESAAASEELSANSKVLKKELDKFKLKSVAKVEDERKVG